MKQLASLLLALLLAVLLGSGVAAANVEITFVSVDAAERTVKATGRCEFGPVSVQVLPVMSQPVVVACDGFRWSIDAVADGAVEAGSATLFVTDGANSSSESFVYDGSPPEVEDFAPLLDGGFVTGTAVSWRVEFSEPVAGVLASQFSTRDDGTPVSGVAMESRSVAIVSVEVAQDFDGQISLWLEDSSGITDDAGLGVSSSAAIFGGSQVRRSAESPDPLGLPAPNSSATTTPTTQVEGAGGAEASVPTSVPDETETPTDSFAPTTAFQLPTTEGAGIVAEGQSSSSVAEFIPRTSTSTTAAPPSGGGQDVSDVDAGEGSSSVGLLVGLAAAGVLLMVALLAGRGWWLRRLSTKEKAEPVTFEHPLDDDA